MVYWMCCLSSGDPPKLTTCTSQPCSARDSMLHGKQPRLGLARLPAFSTGLGTAAVVGAAWWLPRANASEMTSPGWSSITATTVLMTWSGRRHAQPSLNLMILPTPVALKCARRHAL